jgi:hypothetical protein
MHGNGIIRRSEIKERCQKMRKIKEQKEENNM